MSAAFAPANSSTAATDAAMPAAADLTAEKMEFFRTNGWVVIENLLSPATVAALNQRVDDLIEGQKFPERSKICVQWDKSLLPKLERGEITKADAIRKVHNLFANDELFRAHIANPRILAVANALIGPGLRFFGDQLFCKPAFHGGEKPWHQDHAYWPVDPQKMVSCWAALDDATRANGCMRFIPGSHLGPILEHKQIRDWQIDDGVIDESRAVFQELKAGSCLFHHSKTLHATSPNQSPNRRRGMVSIYLNAASRYVGKDAAAPAWPTLLPA